MFFLHRGLFMSLDFPYKIFMPLQAPTAMKANEGSCWSIG